MDFTNLVGEILGGVGVVGLISALVWLIRLEGMVKQNAREIARLGHIEEQTNAQEVRIKQRDEEIIRSAQARLLCVSKQNSILYLKNADSNCTDRQAACRSCFLSRKEWQI